MHGQRAPDGAPVVTGHTARVVHGGHREGAALRANLRRHDDAQIGARRAARTPGGGADGGQEIARLQFQRAVFQVDAHRAARVLYGGDGAARTGGAVEHTAAVDARDTAHHRFEIVALTGRVGAALQGAQIQPGDAAHAVGGAVDGAAVGAVGESGLLAAKADDAAEERRPVGVGKERIVQLSQRGDGVGRFPGKHAGDGALEPAAVGSPRQRDRALADAHHAAGEGAAADGALVGKAGQADRRAAAAPGKGQHAVFKVRQQAAQPFSFVRAGSLHGGRAAQIACHAAHHAVTGNGAHRTGGLGPGEGHGFGGDAGAQHAAHKTAAPHVDHGADHIVRQFPLAAEAQQTAHAVPAKHTALHGGGLQRIGVFGKAARQAAHKVPAHQHHRHGAGGFDAAVFAHIPGQTAHEIRFVSAQLRQQVVVGFQTFLAGEEFLIPDDGAAFQHGGAAAAPAAVADARDTAHIGGVFADARHKAVVDRAGHGAATAVHRHDAAHIPLAEHMAVVGAAGKGEAAGGGAAQQAAHKALAQHKAPRGDARAAADGDPALRGAALLQGGVAGKARDAAHEIALEQAGQEGPGEPGAGGGAVHLQTVPPRPGRGNSPLQRGMVEIAGDAAEELTQFAAGPAAAGGDRPVAGDLQTGEGHRLLQTQHTARHAAGVAVAGDVDAAADGAEGILGYSDHTRRAAGADGQVSGAGCFVMFVFRDVSGGGFRLQGHQQADDAGAVRFAGDGQTGDLAGPAGLAGDSAPQDAHKAAHAAHLAHQDGVGALPIEDLPVRGGIVRHGVLAKGHRGRHTGAVAGQIQPAAGEGAGVQAAERPRAPQQRQEQVLLLCRAAALCRGVHGGVHGGLVRVGLRQIHRHVGVFQREFFNGSPVDAEQPRVEGLARHALGAQLHVAQHGAAARKGLVVAPFGDGGERHRLVSAGNGRLRRLAQFGGLVHHHGAVRPVQPLFAERRRQLPVARKAQVVQVPEGGQRGLAAVQRVEQGVFPVGTAADLAGGVLLLPLLVGEGLHGGLQRHRAVHEPGDAEQAAGADALLPGVFQNVGAHHGVQRQGKAAALVAQREQIVPLLRHRAVRVVPRHRQHRHGIAAAELHGGVQTLGQQVHLHAEQLVAGVGVVEHHLIGHIHVLPAGVAAPVHGQCFAVHQLLAAHLQLDLLQAHHIHQPGAVVPHQRLAAPVFVAAVSDVQRLAEAQAVLPGGVKHRVHPPGGHIHLHAQRGVPQRGIVHIILQQLPHQLPRGGFGVLPVIEQRPHPLLHLLVLLAVARAQHALGGGALQPVLQRARRLPPGQRDLRRLIHRAGALLVFLKTGQPYPGGQRAAEHRCQNGKDGQHHGQLHQCESFSIV